VGMALGRTDDGRVVVRCAAPRGTAAKAGIAAGAEIVSWGGKPTAEALADVPQLFGESTDAGLEEQRLILLPRQPAGERVEVAFVSPEGEEGQATLRAARDGDGLGRPCGEDLADPAEMPVTVEVLPSGIGYVKVNSFAEDLTLTLHAWEWSLRKLRQLDVPALIVDIRDNGGGLSKLPVYMAGSFYDEPFTLAEQIFIDEGGEPALTAIERVEPAPMKWRGPVAVLIGPDCASACELLAAALARNPANLVVGMGATAGVEGGVFPWLLPEGIAFRAPLIGYRDDAGEIFLEGTGVQPNVRVPKTAETLLLTQGAPDAVLGAAEAALLGLTDEATPDDAPPSATPQPTDQPIAAPDPQ
ncbi:MAG TPA: S41 family peptidase, partial [Thermomicrobiales bacterium]|nr:S41 family peptidase [Thermomicrobiales bacterium]